ncbi:metal-dependent hydrolase [candidate division KSB1 bacterium]|nr:metal-dependent hydrolase [candidate division KSB1 bacterium]
MPTPIGHSLMGAACYAGLKNKQFKWSAFWLFLILANLPDIDYLPGILIGAPNRFHHGITHSLGFSVLAGIIAGLLAKFALNLKFLRAFWVCTAVVFSHVILDYLCVDTSLPYGVPLLYPFSEESVLSPILIFSDVYKGATNRSFLAGLAEAHNWRTVMGEILILAPIWGAVSLYKKYSKTRKANLATK